MESEKYPLLDSMKIKQTTCLDKRILIPANIRIIGQANNQLILCLLIQEKLLLVFDQHAVHERIRYERLLADAFDGPQLAIRKIVPPIVYTISESQLSDLASKQSELENYFRLKFKPTSSAAIQVSQLPSCFKQYANQQLFDEFIIETLRLLSTEQTPKIRLPGPFLLEQIKTQACRGAIRFNEPLSRNDCSQLIKALSGCKSCFRCAHGRVLVKPILYVPPAHSMERDYAIRLRTQFATFAKSSVKIRKRKWKPESTLNQQEF